MPQSILGFEINFVNLFYYKNKEQIVYNNIVPSDYGNAMRIQYYGVFDEKFNDQFVELCFPLEIFPQVFNKGMIGGFYIGPSIGIGSEELVAKEKYHTVIDTTNGLEYDQVYQEPTNYPGGSGYYVPISLNTGVIYFYKFVIVNLGYKYTFNIPNPTSNVFLQVGLAIEIKK